jgi:zinc protease
MMAQSCLRVAAAPERGYGEAMVSSSRAARPLVALFLAPFFLAGSIPATGRPAPAARAKATAAQAAHALAPAPVAVDRSPWLFKGSDIPPDPAWHFGTLPNGLRYAVRRNGVPPGQVSIRVRIDAGSLNETDDQQGYAHLIEHLSFRGSRYVPDGEAKRVWQRFGATFGSDSNASTTFTQTVYKLDLPAATEASLGESLKIFSGMMAEPALTDSGLNAERPAVLAEQREAPEAQVRLFDARNALFFAGQPLSERSPIGTIEMLTAATPASVKAFHDAWYRPERAVVILSGDIDPAIAERLIVEHWSGWQGHGPNPADPDFGKPDPAKPSTAAVAEPAIPALVSMAILRPWKFNLDTIEFNQRRLADFLASRIVSRRLEQRARSGASYLSASSSLEDVARSANGTFVSIRPIGDDWASALKDVRAVIADALASPPSQAEVDREIAEVDASMRNDVETARVEAGAKQADDMVQALDIRETVAGPVTSYEIFKGARDKGYFTPETIFASTKRIYTGEVNRAFVNTRMPDQGAVAKLDAALKADVGKVSFKRLEQAAVDFSTLPALGTPGAVTAREQVPSLEMEKITFSNGVKLLLYANPGESGRVYVRVRFGRGYRALPSNRVVPDWAGDIALVSSGVGKLDQEGLDALTSGRQIGMDFDIGDDAFQLAAVSSPADYPDQLRLMAAKLQYPNWDPSPVARARAALLSGYASAKSSPSAVLASDLEGLLRDGDTRWTTPPETAVKKLTPGAFRKFWAPLVASGPIEVSVFGDVKVEDAIAAVGKTFGAMPVRQAAAGANATVRFPAHVATPVVRYHTGPANQAAAVIAWPTGGGSDGIAESRQLDVLAAIFTDRLFDRLRSVAGASYSPQAQSQWPIGLNNGGRIVAIGQVAPENVTLFFKLSREIAAELVSTPVDADELRRTIAPMGQYVLRAATGNTYWLMQTGGGAYDQRRLDSARNVISDFARMTPEQLQALAAKYLQPDKDWTLAVMPDPKKK